MTYRKMNDSDVSRIKVFMESNAVRERLTWKMLEEFSGFTRQALQARDEIKRAYDTAKQRIRQARAGFSDDELLQSKLHQQVVEELLQLRKKVQTLERREALWKRRWYCIAYNIRQLGLLQVVDVDKPAPLGSQGVSNKEVNSILDAFDRDIPPVARRTEG